MTPASPSTSSAASEFHAIYSDVQWADAFYRFLQNVYRLYPEDRFHTLIMEACAEHKDDESIYRYLQHHLPKIKPFLAELFYALPALAKQKKEMSRQTLELLGERRDIHGYVEIGSTGRYISELRKHVRLDGPLVLVNDLPPSNSPVDIAERGQFGKLGSFVPLDNYAPVPPTSVADGSVDLVTCYIGLHHIGLPRLEPFMQSMFRMLKPGGMFILRDHDVTTAQMDKLVCLAHSVFNAGLGAPWEANARELRYFTSVAEWSRRLEAIGFKDTGKRLLQAHDPTDNVLMAFVKPGSCA
jgi:SAM-dependent methyltransferase